MTDQANSVIVVSMFAPYCPTCRHHVLMGWSRVVASDCERGGTLTMRCYCGTLVPATDRPHPVERTTGPSAA